MRLLTRLLLLLAATTVVVLAIDRLVPAPQLAGRIVGFESSATGSTVIGDHRIEVLGSDRTDLRLEIRPLDDPDRLAFASSPGHAFVAAAAADVTWHESRGHITWDEQLVRRLPEQRVESVEADAGELVVRGTLLGDDGDEAGYTLTIDAAGEGRLRARIDLDDPASEARGLDARAPLNRTVLSLAADADEHVLGLGEQYTHLDLKGRTVPIITREQGVGRGGQPITIGADLTQGAGGDWTWTYSAVPLAISTTGTALAVEDTAVARFDFTAAERTTVDVWSAGATFQLVDGPEPDTLLSRTTELTGRMRPLPDWTGEGLILGVQGGTEEVREKIGTARAAGVELAAVWIQDWVGQRTTSFGERLWWSWTLDEQRYPGWDELVADLEADGIRVLTYTNPMLTDSFDPGPGRRDLYAEALDGGYFVEHPDGGPYLQSQGDYSAALIDLTDPEARDWYREVIVDEVAGVGASGWMADFGEALPFDAVLHDGDPDVWHNRYPVAWAELNREALEQAGLGEQGIAFHRSGAMRSPEHATLFWLGDQLVDFSDEDGLGSAVTGLLSGGLSGWTLNHSDTGGYTSVATPIASWERDRELLQRWSELNAFGAVLRSHEGNRPDANHQIVDDAATLAHTARMTRIFTALGPERRRLVEQAATGGLPVVRQGWLVAPDDPRSPTWDRQFFFGEDLLVAPVTASGVDEVSVDVPAGEWRHPWSGRQIEGGRDVDVTLPAPIGEPAVLVRQGSRVDDLLDPGLVGR